MTWNCNERCDARHYTDKAERANFRAGYSDGYHGYPMWSGSERNYYPNAYSAGYWEGVADKKIPTLPACTNIIDMDQS